MCMFALCSFRLACASCFVSAGFVSLSSAADPSMEKRVLFDGNSAKSWYSEEGTTKAASEVSKSGAPTLHWHIDVDYFGGEAKYPVGWPRTGHALKGDECDWSGWDYLHLWIHTRTSRPSLPRVPAVMTILQGQGKSSPLQIVLSDLKKDQWLEVKLPVSKLSLAREVQKIQFNIAEDQYHHQDTLDFHIDEIALLRYAAPTLVDFTSVNAVVFSDAKAVPASFSLSGVKPDESKHVTLQLKRDGAVAASEKFVTKRGVQRLALDVSKATLKQGEYELIGSVEGGDAVAVSRVRVVESPWR